MADENKSQPSPMQVEDESSPDAADAAEASAASADAARTPSKSSVSGASKSGESKQQMSQSRQEAKKLILRYHQRLLEGCGKSSCPNKNCASNPDAKKYTKAQALKVAIALANTKPSPVVCKTAAEEAADAAAATPAPQPSRAAVPKAPQKAPVSQPVQLPDPMELQDIQKLREEMEKTGDTAPLIRYVGRGFADPLILQHSFLLRDDKGAPMAPTKTVSGLDFDALDKAYELLSEPENLQNVLNNTIRRLVLSMQNNQSNDHPTSTYLHKLRMFVLLLENRAWQDPELHPVFRELLRMTVTQHAHARAVLIEWFSRYTADRLRNLVGSIQMYLTVRWYVQDSIAITDVVYAVKMLDMLYNASENPAAPDVLISSGVKRKRESSVGQTDDMNEEVTMHTAALALSPTVGTPASSPVQGMRISNQSPFWRPEAAPADMPDLVDAVSLSASAAVGSASAPHGGSDLSSPVMHRAVSASAAETKGEEKNVRPSNGVVRSVAGGKKKSLLPYEEFYNDAVNERVALDRDYMRWTSGDRNAFAFCQYPFILNAASKARVLQVDSMVQQREQHEIDRAGLLSALMSGRIPSPYLVLEVERFDLIHTTLSVLVNNKDNLKKPLRVKFNREPGLDEGGVKKEFFQLIIAELFDVEKGYDLFTYNSTSRLFWFNKDSVTELPQFQLIGILLGLAIYNGVILDVRFPAVLYRFLLYDDYEPTLEDLRQLDPEMADGFSTLLAFDGDVESTYLRTFSVTWESYGATQEAELKPGGAKIPLTNENREEYVQLYVEWVLHGSVKRFLKEVCNGFRMVADGPTFKLFRPEEVELLVCGSPELDFEALENSTRYDDGYTGESLTIKLFWEVVHAMSDDEKRRLLFFATGSDRVPINGLGDLRFVISRMGPDSDKLPTSHTCFNHLLLPEYKTKEKMEKCLKTAINNAQGFGLL